MDNNHRTDRPSALVAAIMDAIRAHPETKELACVGHRRPLKWSITFVGWGPAFTTRHYAFNIYDDDYRTGDHLDAQYAAEYTAEIDRVLDGQTKIATIARAHGIASPRTMMLPTDPAAAVTLPIIDPATAKIVNLAMNSHPLLLCETSDPNAPIGHLRARLDVLDAMIVDLGPQEAADRIRDCVRDIATDVPYVMVDEWAYETMRTRPWAMSGYDDVTLLLVDGLPRIEMTYTGFDEDTGPTGKEHGFDDGPDAVWIRMADHPVLGGFISLPPGWIE